MKFSRIEYGTEKYLEMIALREAILRKPLGLKFTEEDLARDKSDLLCGCYNNTDILIGTCIISQIDKHIAQLRQMAISVDQQGLSIGRKLLNFAEKVAIDNGYKSIHLHARKTAIGFYLKAGYNTAGSEYMEVGIPHLEMTKDFFID